VICWREIGPKSRSSSPAKRRRARRYSTGYFTRVNCTWIEPRSSLRAKRSNPGERRAPAAPGSPRRFAPRDDDSINMQLVLAPKSAAVRSGRSAARRIAHSEAGDREQRALCGVSSTRALSNPKARSLRPADRLRRGAYCRRRNPKKQQEAVNWGAPGSGMALDPLVRIVAERALQSRERPHRVFKGHIETGNRYYYPPGKMIQANKGSLPVRAGPFVQLSSKARMRNQCSSALPSGRPSRSHSA